jgi:hypothetical protein
MAEFRYGGALNILQYIEMIVKYDCAFGVHFSLLMVV